ncbi:MAG: hypothetical protein DRH90_24515, partial [Deltaproteobacteria bacterium]
QEIAKGLFNAENRQAEFDLNQNTKQTQLNKTNQEIAKGLVDAEQAPALFASQQAQRTAQTNSANQLFNQRAKEAKETQLGKSYQNELSERFGKLKSANPNRTNTDLLSLATASLLNEKPEYAPYQEQGFNYVNQLNNLKTNEQVKAASDAKVKTDLQNKAREEIVKAAAQEGRQASVNEQGNLTFNKVFSPSKGKGDNYSDSGIVNNASKQFKDTDGTLWAVGEKENKMAKGQLILDRVKGKYPNLTGKELSNYVNRISVKAADEENSIFGGGVEYQNVDQYIDADPYK